MEINFWQDLNIYTFVANAPFLYPLKTSEILKLFCFQWVEKRCVGNKWVNVAYLLTEWTNQQRIQNKSGFTFHSENIKQ